MALKENDVEVGNAGWVKICASSGAVSTHGKGKGL